MILVLVLREPVVNLIVIAFLRHKDVHREIGIGSAVEYAHGDSGPITMDRIPEQRRPANRTETAPHLLRGVVPPDVFFSYDRQRRARNIDRGPEVAGLFAAGCAVAGIWLRKFSLNAYLNGSA